MINSNKSLKELQQYNDLRMAKSPRQYREYIEIGIEDLEDEIEQERCKDMILTKFEPHNITVTSAGINPYTMTSWIFSLVSDMKENQRVREHRNGVLDFLKQGVASETFKQGALLGLSGSVTTGAKR